MAYVQNMQDDEDKQNNPAQGPVAPAGGGVHLSPSTASLSGGGGAGSSGGKSDAGGQFASLNQYVDANTPNAEGLANQVVAPYQQQASQMGQQGNEYLGQVDNEVQNAYTPQDKGLVDSAAKNPVSFSGDTNNVASFQKQLNDKYTGPDSVEGLAPYQTLLGDINNQLSSTKSLAGNTAGQETMLKNVESRPGNQGVTGLNEAILSQSPDYLSKVTNAAQPVSDLIASLGTTANTIDQKIGKEQQEAKDAASYANDAFTGGNGAYTNLVNDINSNYKNTYDAWNAANTTNANLKNDISKIYKGPQETSTQTLGKYGGKGDTWANSTNYDVNGGALSAGDLKALGITQDQWNTLFSGMKAAGTSQYSQVGNYGAPSATKQFNLSDYGNIPNLPAPTVASTATPQQYAEMGAINNLFGDNAPTNEPIDVNTPLSGQGTYNPNLATPSFDYSKILSDVNAYTPSAVQAAKDEAERLNQYANAMHNREGDNTSSLNNFIGSFG